MESIQNFVVQNISAGGAGGEGFFAGSRFGGFTKQLLLIWAILAGLLIHNNRCLHLRISKIVFLGFGYVNLMNTGLLSCARTTYARYVTDLGMVCA